MRIVVLIITAVAMAMTTIGTVAAAPQTRAQRHCTLTLHRDGRTVASAQAKWAARCLSEAHAGAIADVAACLEAEPVADVEEAAARASGNAIARCTQSPAEFGLPPAFDETISEAAIVHTRGVATDLLGAVPAVPSGADAQRCQTTVLARAHALTAARSGAFSGCLRRQLKHGAGGAAELEECVTLDASRRSARAERRLRSRMAGRCASVASGTILDGACAGLAGDALADCVVERAVCRACRMLATAAAVDVDCDAVDDGLANDSCVFPVSLAGDAIPFIGGPNGRIEGAEVWVLEHPEMSLTTGPDGHFQFDGLAEGEEVTLVMEHPDYHPIQTGTIRLGARGAERVTFQAPTWAVYDAFAAILQVVPDEANRCQMVTTVTRVGKSIYDTGAHGEDGVTVTLDPPLPAEHGPIYFNASVIPDRSLSETSEDGGVLHIQVPPGEYVWTAYKAGVVFTRIKMKCRVGLLVNASPPWGLQAH